MRFEENKFAEKLGVKIGYLFGYFLFTTILFFLLRLTDKIPSNWIYLDIMIITFLITLIGITLKKFLK